MHDFPTTHNLGTDIFMNSACHWAENNIVALCDIAWPLIMFIYNNRYLFYHLPICCTHHHRITVVLYCMYVCMVTTYSKVRDQPGKVANPSRGQLNTENEHFPVPVRA